ncbi:uncharacterized protein PV06_04754 [Exophiala oligosperma]|uniref:Transcription factor domain-containing protein n=1 Tax=Exophiala oligosperma TaxID=215243 RepID=A0A0D2DMI5_9EURO|nr:uncharacterized protein PV06_04754 [Exophiala oligosperma]KIW43675.1 hypothetical protein PV06_04754 [Exophiala oligosperma]
MAKSIRIQELVEVDNQTGTTQGVSAHTSSHLKHDTEELQPTFRPQLMVQTSNSTAQTSLSAIERFSWEFDKKELASIRHPRKRKSPVDSHQAVELRRAARPPRFSVNIFHTEPINNFPIPSEGCVPRMVKHYLQVWAPQHGRAFAFEGHPKPYQSLVFPFALERAVVFEAIVALSRASWLLQERLPWSKDNALALHRANAFAQLRLRLLSEETCADDATIVTIAALTTIDYMLGIHEGAENHINAMQRIRAIRADLKGDTPWQHFVNASLDAYFSLWNFVKERNAAMTSMSQLTMESPLRNDLPLYPSLPFSTRVCESLSKVSSAFNDMALAGQLSIQIIGIIATLSAMTRNESSGSPSPGSPSTSSAASSAPSSPGERNLLNIIADLRCLSMLGTVPIEHLLCHGLIGCCLRLHFGEEKLGDDFNETLQELEDTLVGGGKPRPQQDLDKFHKEHKDCLLWIAFAAADALDMSAPFSDKFLVLQQTLDRYPAETSRWETLEKILRRFLWNDFLAQYWKRRWQVAIQRQPKPH